MLFRNAHLVLPDRIVPRGSLRIRNGAITMIAEQEVQPLTEEQTYDVQGRFLAPGFIDVHIHGALRRDTMEADPEAFRTICRHHAAGGTTALALTTVTTTSERIIRALHAVRKFREEEPVGARVLGVHIEGPYFSPEKPGAHRRDLIRHPHPRRVRALAELRGLHHANDARAGIARRGEAHRDAGRGGHPRLRRA